MNLIFKCKFGSHLYGTDTPQSDLDYKGIYIPDERDIILQRAKKNITNNTKNSEGIKNNNTDIDFECFSLQEYLKLLCDGQAVALDMLFCNDQNIIQSSKIWYSIKANKDKFLHKNLTAYIGYAKQQAAKYGVKGFRVAALKSTLEWLNSFNKESLLIQVSMDQIHRHCSETEHVEIVYIKDNNGLDRPYLEVCDRKFELKSKIGYIYNSLRKIYDNYGARAQLASKNEGIDWKALSHAVRVPNEAHELLLTGHITFPRPEAQLLLDIKLGKMDYKEVEKLIEDGLEQLKHAEQLTNLPAKPDLAFADEFVYNVYKKEIK